MRSIAPTRRSAPFANRDAAYATGEVFFCQNVNHQHVRNAHSRGTRNPEATGEYAVSRYVQHQKKTNRHNRIVMWGASVIGKSCF